MPISPTHPIPHINPITEITRKLLGDSYPPFKPTNYTENHHYNVKNIAINHQHSASLAGNTNIGHLGGAGATKAHISLVSTASKVGLTAKAGLLACTFTPLLAIAGIATAGYLGYKAYDYFFNNKEGGNFTQNNKKDLDKLNLYQKNNQEIELKKYPEIFKENKEKPSVLLNPSNIEKLHHSTLTI